MNIKEYINENGCMFYGQRLTYDGVDVMYKIGDKVKHKKYKWVGKVLSIDGHICDNQMYFVKF